MPVSFSLRHAYLGSDTEASMLRTPLDLYVVAAPLPPSRRYIENDCSGRSLATLLVAWVSAAMVASILLRWKYMWIALAVLTLLFLLACGYAACSTRRQNNTTQDTHILANDNRRIMEIQSISGELSACRDIIEQQPPAYQAYWITDLPPPAYAVVIESTDDPVGDRLPFPLRQQEGDHLQIPRLSNPPPYSLAIQHDQSINNLNVSSHAVDSNRLEKQLRQEDQSSHGAQDR